MAAETIATRIEEDAIAGVQSASVDGANIQVMSIDDRIKADRHVKAEAAKRKNHAGIGFRTLAPGGCG